MGPKSQRGDQRRDQLLDRIDDRLRDAPDGFHDPGPPAAGDALAAADLPEEERGLWARHDGVALAAGEARILALADIAGQTAAAAEILRPGDRVIGERGRDLFVLPEDPWAEGAAVVLVEEAGDRSPEASSVAHLLLGWLGECAVLYDEHGDWRDELFGEDGELAEPIQRRLCRRRLDLDPDAPNPRLRLAELLAAADEHRAAIAEAEGVLHRAPEFSWAHHRLARSALALGERARARESWEAAAAQSPDPALQSYFIAWAALACDGDARRSLAARVLAARPEFAARQHDAACSLLEREDVTGAREQLELALAVVPGHLPSLELRARLAAQ